jgi:hypothetical protein
MNECFADVDKYDALKRKIFDTNLNEKHHQGEIRSGAPDGTEGVGRCNYDAQKGATMTRRGRSKGATLTHQHPSSGATMTL